MFCNLNTPEQTHMQ